MSIFNRKKKQPEKRTYDPEKTIPVIRASICNGEQVAGFKDIQSGKFEEVMFIRTPEDLESFRNMYDIRGMIGKEY